MDHIPFLLECEDSVFMSEWKYNFAIRRKRYIDKGNHITFVGIILLSVVLVWSGESFPSVLWKLPVALGVSEWSYCLGRMINCLLF